MTKDSERSHVHLAFPRSILFFEEWMKLPLEYDSIYVPSELEPFNPDDDAGGLALGVGGGPPEQLPFGVPKSVVLREKQMVWKELALAELLTNGPHNLLNREETVDFVPSIDALEKDFPNVALSDQRQHDEHESDPLLSSSLNKHTQSVLHIPPSATSKRLTSRGSKHSTSLSKNHRKNRIPSGILPKPGLNNPSTVTSKKRIPSANSSLYSPNTSLNHNNSILHTPISSIGVTSTPGVAHTHSNFLGAASSTPFHTSRTAAHTQMPPPQIRRANHIRRTPFRTPGASASGPSHAESPPLGSIPAPMTPGPMGGRRVHSRSRGEGATEREGPGYGYPGSTHTNPTPGDGLFMPMTPGPRPDDRRESRMGLSTSDRRRSHIPR